MYDNIIYDKKRQVQVPQGNDVHPLLVVHVQPFRYKEVPLTPLINEDRYREYICFLIMPGCCSNADNAVNRKGFSLFLHYVDAK